MCLCPCVCVCMCFFLWRFGLGRSAISYLQPSQLPLIYSVARALPLSRLALPWTPRGHLLEDFSLDFLHPLKCTSRHVHSATEGELLSEREFRQEERSKKKRERNGTSVHYSIYFTKRNS